MNSIHPRGLDTTTEIFSTLVVRAKDPYGGWLPDVVITVERTTRNHDNSLVVEGHRLNHDNTGRYYVLFDVTSDELDQGIYHVS